MEQKNKPLIERYPQKAEAADSPFILFTRHRATYNAASTSTGKVSLETKQHVSLYMPMGININDNMVFETAATGLIGAGYEQLMNGVDPDNFSAADVTALMNQFGDELAMGVGGAIGSKLGIAGAFLGGSAAGGIVKSVLQENQKRNQISMNPREFMLFKSPGMRGFSLSFRFIPDSESESNTVNRIIKWFRTGMYPEQDGATAFKFPDAFQLEFVNVNGIPKIPEVFLESATTTYNPNSMSYFRINNNPVEINFNLEFKELAPITNAQIEEGY